jgi:hypothetical protein
MEIGKILLVRKDLLVIMGATWNPGDSKEMLSWKERKAL